MLVFAPPPPFENFGIKRGLNEFGFMCSILPQYNFQPFFLSEIWTSYFPYVRIRLSLNLRTVNFGDKIISFNCISISLYWTVTVVNSVLASFSILSHFLVLALLRDAELPTADFVSKVLGIDSDKFFFFFNSALLILNFRSKMMEWHCLICAVILSQLPEQEAFVKMMR